MAGTSGREKNSAPAKPTIRLIEDLPRRSVCRRSRQSYAWRRERRARRLRLPGTPLAARRLARRGRVEGGIDGRQAGGQGRSGQRQSQGRGRQARRRSVDRGRREGRSGQGQGQGSHGRAQGRAERRRGALGPARTLRARAHNYAMRPGLLLSALVLAVVVACGTTPAPGAWPAAATDTSGAPGAVVVAAASEGQGHVQITELTCLTCRTESAPR